jgi:hypothetical protein
MIKTVFIASHSPRRTKEITQKIATGETRKGLFGGEKQVFKKAKVHVETDEMADHMVDGARLAHDIEMAATALVSEGYEIISTMPIIGGRYSWQKYGASIGSSADTAVSWGYSKTDGVIITAKKLI